MSRIDNHNRPHPPGRKMNHCELEDLTRHINERISALRQILELRTIAKDQDKRRILRKIGHDVLAIDGLLDQFEKCVDQQRDLLKHLKLIDASFQEGVTEGKHLRDNMPKHMPKKGHPVVIGVGPASSQNGAVQVQAAPLGNPKKTSKKHIKEMEFITKPEYDAIPQYMKGRVTYDQLNAAVQSFNTAVTEKYKIFNLPAKNLNGSTRILRQRFKDDETKDTKGQFFVVEADIKEFSQMKVDKRFLGILNMLRHCLRLRELRGGGITRYVLL